MGVIRRTVSTERWRWNRGGTPFFPALRSDHTTRFRGGGRIGVPHWGLAIREHVGHAKFCALVAGGQDQTKAYRLSYDAERMKQTSVRVEACRP